MIHSNLLWYFSNIFRFIEFHIGKKCVVAFFIIVMRKKVLLFEYFWHSLSSLNASYRIRYQRNDSLSGLWLWHKLSSHFHYHSSAILNAKYMHHYSTAWWFCVIITIINHFDVMHLDFCFFPLLFVLSQLFLVRSKNWLWVSIIHHRSASVNICCFICKLHRFKNLTNMIIKGQCEIWKLMNESGVEWTQLVCNMHMAFIEI